MSFKNLNLHKNYTKYELVSFYWENFAKTQAGANCNSHISVETRFIASPLYRVYPWRRDESRISVETR